MNIEGIKVTYAIQGRLRLKVSKIKHNPTLAAQVQEKFCHVKGIKHVETSPITGSILLLYDKSEISSSKSLESILELFARFFPEAEIKEFQSWLKSSLGLSTLNP